MSNLIPTRHQNTKEKMKERGRQRERERETYGLLGGHHGCGQGFGSFEEESVAAAERRERELCFQYGEGTLGQKEGPRLYRDLNQGFKGYYMGSVWIQVYVTLRHGSGQPNSG